MKRRRAELIEEVYVIAAMSGEIVVGVLEKMWRGVVGGALELAWRGDTVVRLRTN